MPWTKADVKRFNKGLSPAQEAKWVAIANNVLSTCLKAGGSQETCEAKAIRIASGQVKESQGGEDMQEAVWGGAKQNDLPDSAFAYIEPGGTKDADGKTVPRSKRHFPIKNANGEYDAAHVRNALARAPQSPFGDKAMPKIRAAAKALKIGAAAESVDVSFTTELLEAKAIEGRQGIYELTLLREGETSDKKRTYKRTALESAVTLFEGAQAYADHPTKSEIKDRPERSIRDIIGVYENARVEADSGVSKLKADLKTLESAKWVRPLLDLAVEQPKVCGASIHADGTVTPGKPDIVESIDSVFSVDIVTKPNAGGKVERLIASIRDEEGGDDVKIEELNIETLKKDRPDLVEALQKEVKPKEDTGSGEVDMTKFVAKEDYDKLNDKYEATVIEAKIKASGLTDKIADDKDKELVTTELAESMKGKTEEDMDKVIEARKALVKSIKGQIVNPAKETEKGMYKIGSILSEAGQAAQSLVR